MLNFADILALAGLFVLRVGVPLLIMIGLVYLLKRLDRRWEAEARATQQRAKATGQPGVQPAVQPQAPRSATVVRVPTQQPQLPWVPPPAVGQRPGQQPGLMTAPAPQPCWDIKGCSDSQRTQCAAPKRPDVPCWQARFDAEGAIPEDCVKCELFQRYPMM
jgi:hypothetical protein